MNALRSEVESVRQQLLSARMDLLETMARLGGSPSCGQGDSYEDGVAIAAAARDRALVAVFEADLERIDGALSRIREGNYGICAGCGRVIPSRRLEALPFATLCVACQSKADKIATVPRSKPVAAISILK